jgi:hypothetical protein
MISVMMMMMTSCTDDGGPRLDRAEPRAARAGETVTLYGHRLCGGDCATAAGKVQLGLSLPTILAPVVSYEDEVAQISVPVSAPIGATEIVVTVNERSSNALDFEVLP